MANILLQLGDIASRLRRFTRATGSLSTDMNLTLIPTVQVQDISQAPFASEPRCGVSMQATGAGAAGNASFITVQAAPGTALIVDQLDLVPQAASVQFYGIWIAREAPFPNPTYTLARASIPTTNIPANSTAGAAYPLLQATGQGANTIGAGSTIGLNVFDVQTPINTSPEVSFRFPEPIVLFGGNVAQPQTSIPTGDLFIVGGPVVQAISGQIWVREFPLLQGVRNQ
jgi:hypothetical protein